MKVLNGIRSDRFPIGLEQISNVAIQFAAQKKLANAFARFTRRKRIKIDLRLFSFFIQIDYMKLKISRVVFAVLNLFILTGLSLAQTTKKVETPYFKEIIENKLKNTYGTSLKKICPIETDSTAKRIFIEYGAIFVADNEIKLPSRCIFSNEKELQDYQVRASPQTATVGGVVIILQKPAMQALLKAVQEAAKKNLRISPRGGSLAAKRSFGDTVKLWNSRFYPGLSYWVGQKKISPTEAAKVKDFKITEQVAKVLEWEGKNLFFSKDLTKSILYSVAAPGASQHNFMLALDVEQFANKEVRKILAENGWFQTVKSDLPHFTYLGVKETDLPALGLKSVVVGGQKFWIPNF